MHYTTYVNHIKDMLKKQEYKDAEKLLLHCIDLTEKESREERCGVAPWYYERLAILYRKEKRFSDEVGILERYDEQIKAPGVKPEKLRTRLAKTKEKLKKSS